ncbi:unnamed protein product, partial [Durusdinium trenchii]
GGPRQIYTLPRPCESARALRPNSACSPSLRWSGGDDFMEDTGETEEVEPSEQGESDEAREAEVENIVKSPEAVEEQVEPDPPRSVRSPGGSDSASSTSRWRIDLLEQAKRRDEPYQGLLALYDQYSKCHRRLEAMDLKSGSSCSVRLGQQPAEAEKKEADPEMLQQMRQKDAEVQALQRQNHELQDELHEKEVAHAEICREATRLSQENGKLKNELEQLRDQLRQLEQAPRSPVASGAAGLAVDLIETRPPELPEHQKVRGNLQTELTCISAALQSSSSSLPRSLVAVGTSDGFVKLLDGVTGRLAVQVSVARQLPKVIDLHLAEGTGVLLAASSDQAVRVLDLQRQRLLFTLCGHRGLVSACGWLQASRAFTAGADRTVKLWDVQTGQMVRSMPCPAPVTTARAHRSSGVVVAGYADGRLSVLDQRVPGPPADAVRLHQSAQAVVGVQLSQDGNWVLSQAQDGSLCCTALGCPEPTLRLQASGALDSGSGDPEWRQNHRSSRYL